MTLASDDKLRRLAEAADAGPWELAIGNVTRQGTPVYHVVGPSSNPSIPSPDVVATAHYSDRLMPNDNANMAFIAAMCPVTTLALLDERDQALTRAQAAEKRLGEVESPLWAVHVRGPDDVVPVPSYEHAVLLSDQVNWWWAALPVTENDAIISAIPMLWDGTAEQHAAEVVKVGTKASDYRLPTPEQVDRARDKAFAARVTHGGRKPA